MTVRNLRASDIPILQSYAEVSGFPYPELGNPHIEAISVVVDSEDRPLVAGVAKRLIESYLYVSPGAPAAVLKTAIQLLHEDMAKQLRPLGYNSIEAFLPPDVSGKFGRRLERTWGWIKNWPSWTIRF